MAEGKENFPRRQEREVYRGVPQRQAAGAAGDKRRKTRKSPKPQKRKGTGRPRISRRRAVLGICAIILLVIIYILVRKNGTEVFVGETSVGVLEGRSTTAESIVETIETQLAGIVGTKVQLNEEIKAEPIHISSSRKKDICTMEHLIPKIRNLVTYKVDAAMILVDGSKAVVLATEEQANAVLETIQEPYLPTAGTEATVGWVEEVLIQKGFVESEEVLTEADAVSILQSTTTVTGAYTIQSGDALYKIAQSYQCTVEELLQMNEGMTIESGIRVGQVINVPIQKPRVSVKTVEQQVLTTVEPKTYEYRSDNTQPTSYQKVIQQGRAGQKKSTIQITRINGFVEEEKEISKEIITEPVPEIIVRGTL